MRILLTTDWYEPVVNGVVASVLTLTKGLEELGHEVRILTLSGELHSHREGKVSYLGSMSADLVYPDARLKVALSHRYLRDLVDWRPHVVHSQCEFSTFFFARRIARSCGAPLVHTYHTVYEDFTHYFSPSARLGRVMAEVLSRMLLAKTSAIIAPTEKVAAMLTRYGVNRPIYTVPSGLQLERFIKDEPERERSSLREQLGIGPTETIFVYVGRLGREKNVEELFELLTTSAPAGSRLLLIGDGPHRQHLERRASILGITDRLIFTGMVPPSEIWRYYRAGDVFVSASQSETQGLTYIEAMASGLPVLCKKDACLNTVIHNGHNGFNYTSPEEFGRAAEELFAHPEHRVEVGRTAQRDVQERFSAESFAHGVLTVYRAQIAELAARKGARKGNRGEMRALT